MDEEFDETYKRIKAAAVSLFADRGYVATGIRDIAKKAGFSSTALYVHSPNKQELLVDIMRDGFEMQIANARAALESEQAPPGKLAALVRQHVLFETLHRTLATVLTVEYRFLPPEAREDVLPLRDAYEQIWREVIEEGVKGRDFDVPDSRLARLALLEMCSSPEIWYSPDGRLTPSQIADDFVAMALDLVRATESSRVGAAAAS